MKPADIIAARDRLGLSQQDLAARAGISLQSVSRMERGIRVRPDSMKALCAALDVPLTPLETTVLVMPERLKSDPDTQQMLAACSSLPHIRYLVRPDAIAWAAYIKGQFWKRPFSYITVDTNLGMAILCLAWVCLMFGLLILAMIGHPTVPFGPKLGLAFMACACIAGAGYLAYEQFLGDWRRIYRSTEFRGGYAIAEEAIWALTVKTGALSIERIDLAPADERRFRRDGPFVNLSLSTGRDSRVIEHLPEHPGVIDLIERPRPDDRHRTIPLPLAAQAA